METKDSILYTNFLIKIITLTKQYPNDMDLGKNLRILINDLQENLTKTKKD